MVRVVVATGFHLDERESSGYFRWYPDERNPMSDHGYGNQGACDCSVLDPIEPVLREHRAASGQLVVLTDEGMLCVVDTWPHACLPESCCGHAWSDAEWAAFLEGFTVHGHTHHVTADGRAVIPVDHDQLLWGALVVDPGEACPDAIAAAVAPRTTALGESVRQYLP